MPKKKPKNTTHLLIDGDMLVYTLGYATERKGTFSDGSTYHEGDLPLCKSLIKRAISSYLRILDCRDYTLVLSGSGNWRTQFYPEYKANRVTLTKPICYNEIRQWMQSLPNAIVVNGEEADDWLAAKVTAPLCPVDENYIEYIIVSADKDFFTVPGRLYNLTSKRLFHPDNHYTFSFLFFQALSGDRVDGYYGVKWLGQAKVKRILQACHQKKMTIRQAYLFIKSQVTKRSREEWKNFRVCLDLAALRWDGEVGKRGIGLLRVFKHRRLPFRYFLPYYEVAHNKEYGKALEDGY